MPKNSRLLALVIALVLVTHLDAAPRRRSVGFPVFAPGTAGEWLARNAFPLHSAEPLPYTYDLEPLRAMVGDAQVVGLGDGTHGTREFYTVKLRVIEFLVREMNFDVVTFEGPFAIFNRLDAYVQGGAGDPREHLREAHRMFYFFWNTEEIVALIEWMRAYNMQRGDRPAVRLGGSDVYGQTLSSKDVIAYLRNVDPAAAATAEQEYTCLSGSETKNDCDAQAARVLKTLRDNEAAYLGRSSATAYHEAVQHALVVTQTQAQMALPQRDADMATNTLWMRERRSVTRRVIYWGHNEHVTKAKAILSKVEDPAGELLASALEGRYFSIGTFTAAGSFLETRYNGATRQLEYLTSSFGALQPNAYETYFRERGMRVLLIPLRGDLPEWLRGPAPYHTAGNSGGPWAIPASMPAKFDAAIFIDTTTPYRLLPPP